MSKARFSGGKLMNIILERYPYRYVECGTLDNGYPDYRIQKYNEYTERYRDMYLCDNGCLLYTSPSPRDATLSRMPSSA